MNAERKWIFRIALITAIISFAVFIVAIINGWFGETGTAGADFCEAEHEGLIKQPANTWSNFAFIAAGLLTARQLASGKFQANNNSMTRNIFYATFFSCIIVLLGPGSMAMHATQTRAGGFFDMLSMYLIASFMTAYSFQRFFNLKPVHFTIIFVTVLSTCIYANFSDTHFIFEYFGNTAFAFYISLSILFELLNAFIKKMQHKKAWGFSALAFLLTAFTIWNLSLDDSPFCDPSSIIQGHAIWHILDAAAAYCLFRHYVSETSTM
jgi:hypothetical protein